MAHYYFAVRNGRESCSERTGLDLPDLNEAKRAAFVLAGTLLANPAREYWKIPDWAIDVTDGEHHVLLTLAFHQSVAACVSLQSMINRYGVVGADLPEVIGLAS